MGKASRQRRRAKEKERQRRRDRERPPGASRGFGSSWPFGPAQPTAAELAEQMVAEAVHVQLHGDEAAFGRYVARLADWLGVSGRGRALERAAATYLRRGVAAAWRLGWQPADVVRYVAREYGGRHARMATDAVAAEMRGYAAATVDERWEAQLRALDASVWWAHDDRYLRGWADRESVDHAAAVTCALEVLALLAGLPPLPRLLPLPGTARGGARRAARSSPHVDDRVLGRIRALLTKAEATEFPEEAEALSGRAQQLMARHSIDRALLEVGSGASDEPESRRLAVDNPYEGPKAMLLDVVAAANRCRAVWHRRLGFSTVLGFPADLEAVELLLTSLLVQATSAMVRAGSRRDGYGRSRTRSFRQSFLTAYAGRIGERLREAADEATAQAAGTTGKDLLPVLAARDHAVDRAVEAMFPELEERTLSRSHDHEGWLSGRAAADLASLNTRSEVTAEALF